MPTRRRFDLPERFPEFAMADSPDVTPDRVAPVASHTERQSMDPAAWGRRYLRGDPKGLGYFGPLQTPSGGVMSELSLGPDEFGGMAREGRAWTYPSVVPTLTRAELQTLLHLPDGQDVPAAIKRKAYEFAKTRIESGRDPFASPEEARPDIYPEFLRVRLNGPLPPK